MAYIARRNNWQRNGAAVKVTSPIVQADENRKAFSPSPSQKTIFDFVKNDTRNLFVRSGAGTGKTTTSLEVIKLAVAAGKSVIYLAFGNAIVADVKDRIPSGADCRTTHSLGNLALRGIANVRYSEGAIEFIVKRAIPDGLEKRDFAIIMSHGMRLISLMMNTLTSADDEEAIDDLIERYGIEMNGADRILRPVLPFIFQEIVKLPRNRKETKYITYDHMLYLPALGIAPLPHYDVVIVDEAQDQNAAQLAMLQRMAARGSRIIAVGDENQAIFGFRGADTEAVEKLITGLSMVALPLMETYRCPKSHVALANEIVPELVAHPSNSEGTIVHKTLDAMMRDGDLSGSTMAICRTNAPMVSAAFKLIRNRIPAYIQGRDLGAGLIRLIEKLADGNDAIGNLFEKLDAWLDEERGKLAGKRHMESKIQSLQDKYDTIHALADEASTVQDIIRNAERIFDDTANGRVCLSTVHRAKGKEARTVVILSPELLPLKMKSAWEAKQEMHIKYVALTRSLDTLIFEVTDAQRGKGGNTPPAGDEGEGEALYIESLQA